jgi:hypothetical protein
MRTKLLVAGGSALFGLFLVAAMIFGDSIVDPIGFAVRNFVGIWVVAAFANLWFALMEMGPGHSFRDEFPRFLAVLAVPITIALVVPWEQMAA